MHPDPSIHQMLAHVISVSRPLITELSLFSLPAAFFSFYSTQWIYVIENALGEAESVSACLQLPQGTCVA